MPIGLFSTTVVGAPGNCPDVFYVLSLMLLFKFIGIGWADNCRPSVPTQKFVF